MIPQKSSDPIPTPPPPTCKFSNRVTRPDTIAKAGEYLAIFPLFNLASSQFKSCGKSIERFDVVQKAKLSGHEAAPLNFDDCR